MTTRSTIAKKPLFDESTLDNLADKWKIVETKDHKKQNAFFKSYEQTFVDEVMDHVKGTPEGSEYSRKDSMLHKLSYMCKSHADDIELFLFSYRMTIFGDKKFNYANKPVKDGHDETYREAAIRMKYHALCKPLASAPAVKDDDEDNKETGPAPFNYVFDFTDARYKIAQMFGNKFTVFKKWRPVDNGFNKPTIRTYQVTLFLKFYPLGIDDEEWLAKKPEMVVEEKIVNKIVNTLEEPDVEEKDEPKVDEPKVDEPKVDAKPTYKSKASKAVKSSK
jgi:hypothetical protein